MTQGTVETAFLADNRHIPSQATPAANDKVGPESVDALLATTAKLLAQPQALSRSCSKQSSTSRLQVPGLDELRGAAKRAGSECESSLPGGRDGFGHTDSPWAVTPSDPAANSQEGSPLIRAERPLDFSENGRPVKDAAGRSSDFSLREKTTSPVGAKHDPPRAPGDVRRQIKYLRSSIGAIQSSLSDQAAGRARVATKIPRLCIPRPTGLPESLAARLAGLQAVTDADGNLQAELRVEDEARVAVPVTSGEEQQPSVIGAASAEGCLHGSSSLGDPGQSMSALFESLWDTDDEDHSMRKTAAQASETEDRGRSSMDQVWHKISRPTSRDGDAAPRDVPASPSADASTPTGPAGEGARYKKGAHKRSAESGTLKRKMRGLEAAWQELEKLQSVKSAATGSTGGRDKLSEKLRRAATEAAPVPGPRRSKPAPSSNEVTKAPKEVRVGTGGASAAPLPTSVPSGAGGGATAASLKPEQPPAAAGAAPHAAAETLAQQVRAEQTAKRASGGAAPDSAGPGKRPSDQAPPKAKSAGQQKPTAAGQAAAPSGGKQLGSAARTAIPIVAAAGHGLRIELPLPEVKEKKGLRLKFWKGKTSSAKPQQKNAQARPADRAGSDWRSSSDGSPEKPAKSKDSFSRLTGLFKRRSMTGVSPRPLEPPQAVQPPAPAPAAPKPTTARGYATAAPPAAASVVAGPSSQASQSFTEASCAQLKDKKRFNTDDREDSAQGWVSNDEAVKQLLVPTWVPSSLELPSHVATQATSSASPQDICKTRPALDETSIKRASVRGDVQVVALGCDARAAASPLLRSAEPQTPPSPVAAAHGTVAAGGEDGDGAVAGGPSSQWLSPEKAVKNLLVPTWVPNKLPFGTAALADEQPGSATSSEAHEDLIAAVSPRQASMATPTDWSNGKVPFPELAVPGSGPQLSTHRSLRGRPAAVPEDEPATEAAEPQSPASHKPVARAASGQPTSALTPPSVARKSETRPTHLEVSGSSLPPRRASEFGYSTTVGRERQAQPENPPRAKEGFFKALFRRRSESNGKQRPPPQATTAARRVSDGGTLPALSYRQLPAIPAGVPFSTRTTPPVPAKANAAEHKSEVLPAASRRTSTIVVEPQLSSDQEAKEARRQSCEPEFSFCVPATAAPAGDPSSRDRTPSTGRRRVTDEDLGNLQRCYQVLEDTYEKLPSRAVPRGTEKEGLQPARRAHKLPQADFFERAAGNARPRPWSASGTAEAVPFIMRKLPSPAAEERPAAARGFRHFERAPYEPVALTTTRWSESLRSPEKRKPAEARLIKQPGAGGPESRVSTAGSSQGGWPRQRAVSPFGRVRCEPERVVPFLTSPAAGEASERTGEPTITRDESQIVRVENQLKSSAGADSGHGSPQWRVIAERAVKGSAATALEGSDETPSIRPAQQRMHASPVRRRPDSLFVGEGAGPAPSARAISEPVVVDSNRPAFPALKAYLGAKSPAQPTQRSLADDPEIAACRGVSALQQRFEGGMLLASNVAALEKQFEDQRHARERTAAWASGSAVDFSPGRRGAQPLVIGAGGHDARHHAPSPGATSASSGSVKRQVGPVHGKPVTVQY